MFLPHFDVICNLLLNRRTATWNLLVLYSNEERALFISKSFNVSSKAGLRPLWRARTKAIWRSLLSIQNEAISLVAMRSKELWLVQENHATVTVDLSVASRGMKTLLQRKQNWTAKSTNLKKILDKSSQFLSSEQPCKPESLDVARKIAGVELMRSENLQLRSAWRPFDSSYEWEERYWPWKFVSSVFGDSQISLK